ncbi:MAG: hypothetical protein QOJ84_4434 [Bradyrhizobium sp.]|nr:hypothetical protein [Bradyrhizobium sp.]
MAAVSNQQIYDLLLDISRPILRGSPRRAASTQDDGQVNVNSRSPSFSMLETILSPAFNQTRFSGG